MPVTFTSRPPRPSSSPEPAFTNADDSIVLSDLVRSGEASRLRRRGAIRDGPLSSHRQTSSMSSAPVFSPPAPTFTATASRSLFRPLSPVWRNDFQESRDPDFQGVDDDVYQYDDDEDANGEWQWGRTQGAMDSAGNVEREGRRQALEADIRLEDTDHSSGSFILLCGAEIAPDAQDLSSHFASTSNAPRRKPSAFCPVSPAQRPPRPRRTNGCGAIVHLSGIPRRRHGVWIARGAATPDVVSMPTSYFDCTAVAKMMKSACGCVREGVGCSVCGNILGTIYTPCQAAADGLFTPPTPTTARPTSATTNSSSTRTNHAHSPSTTTPEPSFFPSGPSYWLPPSQSSNNHSTPTTSSSSKKPSSPPRLAIYTFFSTHVRSTVPYTFPAVPTPPPSSSTPAPTRAPAQISQYDTALPAASSSSSILAVGYGAGPRPSVYPYGAQRLTSSSNIFGRSNESQPSRSQSLSLSQSQSRAQLQSRPSYPYPYPSPYPYASQSQSQSQTTLASTTSLGSASGSTVNVSDPALPTPRMPAPLQRQNTVTSENGSAANGGEPLPTLSSAFDPSQLQSQSQTQPQTQTQTQSWSNLFSNASSPPPPPSLPPPSAASPAPRFPPLRRWTSYALEDVLLPWDAFENIPNGNGSSAARSSLEQMEDRERNRDTDRERIRLTRRGRTRMPSFAAPPASSAVSPMVGAIGGVGTGTALASTAQSQTQLSGWGSTLGADVLLEVAARRRERERVRQVRSEDDRWREERERQRERDREDREERMRQVRSESDRFREERERHRERDREEREQQRARDREERERQRERDREGDVAEEAGAGEGAAVNNLVNLSAMFSGADENGDMRDGRDSMEGREYSYEEMRMRGASPAMDMEAEIEMVEDEGVLLGDEAVLDSGVFDADAGDVGEKPEGTLSPGSGGMMWAER